MTKIINSIRLAIAKHHLSKNDIIVYNVVNSHLNKFKFTNDLDILKSFINENMIDITYSDSISPLEEFNKLLNNKYYENFKIKELQQIALNKCYDRITNYQQVELLDAISEQNKGKPKHERVEKKHIWLLRELRKHLTLYTGLDKKLIGFKYIEHTKTVDYETYPTATLQILIKE